MGLLKKNKTKQKTVFCHQVLLNHWKYTIAQKSFFDENRHDLHIKGIIMIFDAILLSHTGGIMGFYKLAIDLFFMTTVSLDLQYTALSLFHYCLQYKITSPLTAMLYTRR